MKCRVRGANNPIGTPAGVRFWRAATVFLCIIHEMARDGLRLKIFKFYRLEVKSFKIIANYKIKFRNLFLNNTNQFVNDKKQCPTESTNLLNALRRRPTSALLVVPQLPPPIG
jgi:hypothetical protein